MPSRLTGFVCPTVSMVTTGHATGVEKTLLTYIVVQGDVSSLDIHQRAWQGTMAGQEAGISGVLIGINKELGLKLNCCLIDVSQLFCQTCPSVIVVIC